MAELFGTVSSNETVNWNPEPTTRGTFGILSTCVITLTLCVWSSVHLNLPGNNPSRYLKFWRRLGWLICSLIAPEFLIMVAWSQRRRAYDFQEKVEKALNPRVNAKVLPSYLYSSSRCKFIFQANDSEIQSPGRQHEWTITHSYWAIMGGISADTDSIDRYIPGVVLSRLMAFCSYLNMNQTCFQIYRSTT